MSTSYTIEAADCGLPKSISKPGLCMRCEDLRACELAGLPTDAKMVFEESTFVLPKAAAKVAPEPVEPAVQDPRAKRETVEAAAPAATVKAPPIGELQMLGTKICRVHLPGCSADRPITYRSRCSGAIAKIAPSRS